MSYPHDLLTVKEMAESFRMEYVASRSQKFVEGVLNSSKNGGKVKHLKVIGIDFDGNIASLFCRFVNHKYPENVDYLLGTY